MLFCCSAGLAINLLLKSCMYKTINKPVMTCPYYIRCSFFLWPPPLPHPLEMCGFHTHSMDGHWKLVIGGGWGVSKANFLLEFPEGLGGGKPKNYLWGRVWLFSGTTQFQCSFTLLFKNFDFWELPTLTPQNFWYPYLGLEGYFPELHNKLYYMYMHSQTSQDCWFDLQSCLK